MAIMQVSRKIDYALRAVIHLANEEDSERACSVAEIAAREKVPRHFARSWGRAAWSASGARGNAGCSSCSRKRRSRTFGGRGTPRQ